jgi:hypothetical protein
MNDNKGHAPITSIACHAAQSSSENFYSFTSSLSPLIVQVIRFLHFISSRTNAHNGIAGELGP